MERLTSPTKNANALFYGRRLRLIPVKVYYNETLVGDYFADLIVENCVIIELKVAEAICEAHEAQLLNYLKATEIEVGMLLNFGAKPEYRRKIFTNDKKGIDHGSDGFNVLTQIN